MALTDAGAATSIASATAKALSGTYKVRADGITGSNNVVVYEEDNDSDYQVVLDGGAPIVFTTNQPSMNLELYGNYKFVTSDSGISVGYAS